MHGHGDRPHMCKFTGCDRSAPGAGFPRRYNLYDHMKRVHDYKEDDASAITSPVMGLDTGLTKKAIGRKRKASSPTLPEPAQRPRTISAQVQPTFQGGREQSSRTSRQHVQSLQENSMDYRRASLQRGSVHHGDLVHSPQDGMNFLHFQQNPVQIYGAHEHSRRY